jgi:hypothetical protein
VLVLPEYGDWSTVGALDAVTHHRTMRSSGVVRPRVLMAPDTYDLQAERAWYIELPFIRDTTYIPLIARRFDY